MASVALNGLSSVEPPRFDWYAATINVAVDDLRTTLCADLGATAEPSEGAKHGYHHREILTNGDGQTVATILHGGNGGIPHAYASSDHAHAFSESVRAHWSGRHRVSRMDCAIDFDNGPGTFDTLFDICGGIADGVRVDGDTRKRVGKIKTNQQGDWRHEIAGRTFYLGAFKSAVLVRLYEKGIELQSRAERVGKRRDDLSRDLVRLEVQVRPDGDSKRRASSATPLEAWGYSEWSRELLRRIDETGVERVNIKERRESDHERAMQWMVKQYGAHLLQEVADLGSWEALGRSLRRRLELGHSSWDDADNSDERPF